MQTLQNVLETHRPWPPELRAIYDVLADWFAANDDAEPLPELPDEASNVTAGGLRWAAGARDGVATHHMIPADDDAAIDAVFGALSALVQAPSAASLEAFYAVAREHQAVAIVDGVLQRIVAADDPVELSAEAVFCLANWLVTCAPDREPVKLGIALLGLFDSVADLEPLIVLAHHDELTLFAMVALLRLLDEPVDVLFSLAREVRGWGRVHLVERLVTLDGALDDPEIRDWLLREGFRNDVLDSYLALRCAEAADLAGALADEPDDELVDAARDLVATLCETHGPAGTLFDYTDGALAVERLLSHLEQRTQLPDLSMVLDLHALLLDEAHVESLERLGWTPRIRRRVTARCVAFVQQPMWVPLLDARLTLETDLTTFQQAAALGERVGMDTWSASVARLEATGEEALWWLVTRTDDGASMERIAALAQARLPLQTLATGPETRPTATGSELALLAVIQPLDAWPGVGAPLVETALRARPVVLRNRALAVLEAWDRETWPAGVADVLARTRDAEPVDEVRARIEALLGG